MTSSKHTFNLIDVRHTFFWALMMTIEINLERTAAILDYTKN